MKKGDTEAVARRCSVKKFFFKNSQNSQYNTCIRACGGCFWRLNVLPRSNLPLPMYRNHLFTAITVNFNKKDRKTLGGTRQKILIKKTKSHDKKMEYFPDAFPEYVKHLRWSAFSCQLFLQNDLPQMFDKAQNTPLVSKIFLYA